MMTDKAIFSGGSGQRLGMVDDLPQRSFGDLVRDVFGLPVTLPITHGAFLSLPKQDASAPLDRDRVKRTNFVTPGYIPPGRRRRERVTCCNLAFIDIDDGEDATRVLDRGGCIANDLAPYNFALYRTASSTPEAPRLRVVVEMDALPPSDYRAAVQHLATLIGLGSVTSESCVPSQPMFVPVRFSDTADNEESHPLLQSRISGEKLLKTHISGHNPTVGITYHDPTVGITEDNFEHLRQPVDDVTEGDIRDALSHLDPDMKRRPWINIAAGLKHQFKDDGFELWREWSSRGSKYQGDDAAKVDWDSLSDTPLGRAPITIRSVLQAARESGWKADAVTERCFASISSWLSDTERSDTDLIRNGVKRIASTPLLTPIERGVLLEKLSRELRRRGVPISRADLNRGLRKAEADKKGLGGDDDEPPEESDLPKWLTGIVFVSDLNEFYQHAQGRKWSVDAFNNSFSRYLLASSEEEAGGRPAILPQHYALNVAKIRVCDSFTYRPDYPGVGCVKDKGVWRVNTYRASYALATSEFSEEVGDAVWKHTLKQFGSEKYARALIDWMAYIVQNPGKKILWAPMLQGAEGSGKTFYYVVMELALGHTNTKMVKSGVLMNNEWNDWAADCQLVFLNEIRVVGKSRHSVMDKLKDLITDLKIPINQKRQDTRIVRNFANYLLATNYQDALAITGNDRRYFVLFAKQQTKQEIQATWPDPYFPNLYDLIRENAGSLRGWLLNWKISPDFNPNKCPNSEYKKDLVEQAASPIYRAVETALLDGDNPLCKADLVSLKSLRDAIEIESRGLGSFTDQTLTSILREMGYGSVGRIRIESERHSIWSKGIKPELAQALALTRHRGEGDLL